MSARIVLYLIGAVILAAAYYVAQCAWWPLAKCRRCKGEGKFKKWTGNAWRLCGRCKGHGDRIRHGRRIYDRLRTDRAKAVKAQ